MNTLRQPRQPLSRNDRHVRRASLRLPAGVSEHRATFLIEEALRLTALPGEEQGRTYYFRRVSLRGLSMAAPPNEWVDRAQTTMQALALQAVHGTDVRSVDADAVFFNSQEEALEWLLRRLLRNFPRGIDAAGWFAPMISLVARGTDATAQLVAVIERLRSLPAGWFVAATVLLAAIEADAGAFAALDSVPEQMVRIWIRELGDAPIRSNHVPKISSSRRRMLRECLAVANQAESMKWAFRDAGVEPMSSAQASMQRQLPAHLLWITALAIAAEDPGELSRGSAATSARAVLEQLAASIDDLQEEDRRRQLSSLSEESERGLSKARDPNARKVHAEDEARKGLEQDGNLDVGADRGHDPSLFTAAGGLYFLLNVLRRLGIEAAIEALPSSFEKIFLAKLMRSLARAASVADEDSAMLWVDAALDAAHDEEDFDSVICAADCWPRSLISAPKTEVTLDRLVRVWTVAVRRWCWLNARLTLREIVARPGRMLLTRTDLDVTLSMETVDLRVRRAGLDLDPGWLPWFGRVVRFHYAHSPARTGVDGGEAR